MGDIQHAELLWGGHVALGSRSIAVRKIQEWLCFHDLPVVIDGVFGRETQSALAHFFHKPVAQCEAVDSYRFAQLSAPLRRAVQIPAHQPPETLAQAVLAIARQHLVQKPIEIGGANSGPWVRHYMRGRQGAKMAWCIGFVSTVWAQAARWQGCPLPGYTTSCDWLAHTARDEERFTREGVIPASPCAVFLHRRSPQDWDHGGFAFDFTPFGFASIEGNTNDDGSREGVKVCQRKRSFLNVDFVELFPGT
jgi:hypothetical protein